MNITSININYQTNWSHPLLRRVFCALVLTYTVTLGSDAFAAPVKAEATKVAPKESKTASLLKGENANAPTYINSNSVQLDSASRTFVYTGSVEVTQGDMRLTSDILEGNYTEKNEIEQLTARRNVTITKGPNVKAKSNKAVFDAKTEIVTLTENPEIVQESSTLTADKVRVYLKEDRSEAEGQVRVKLNKTDGAAPGDASKSLLPTKAPGK